MLDVSILIQALPYIREFRDKLFVVKFGGEIARDQEHLEAIAGDVTLLSLVGIKIVVVHGGGPQANEMSELLGFKPQIVQGRRITDEKALEVAKMVFAGKINVDILSALRKHGGRGVGLSGIDSAIVKAKKRPITKITDRAGATTDVDFGYVGDIESVDTDLIMTLVNKGYIPVFSSLAADDDGTVLNINADTVAADIAIKTGAEKLITMTTVPGIYKDFATKEEIWSVLSASQARGLFKDGSVGDGMLPKIEACAKAVEGGVHETHMINGLTRHSLLMEVFTRKGIGTMIVADKLAPLAASAASA